MAKNNDSAATIGFENELWRAADALRSNMDAEDTSTAALSS
jgi:type I restriction enzyme M protein